MLSTLPIVTALIAIVIFVVLLLIVFLSKTKTATNEARLGNYEIIVLPNGNRYSGMMTLARRLVNTEKTHFLYTAEKISEETAKKLDDVFTDWNFYAMKQGNRKVLIVSSKDLQSEQYSVTTDQIFSIPYGYSSQRLVIADGITVERAGWLVVSILPRPLDPELQPETSKQLTEIGEMSATITSLYVKASVERPYKVISENLEKQLHDAQEKLTKEASEKEMYRMAAAKKPLISIEPEIEPETERESKGLDIQRIAITVLVGVLSYLFILPPILNIMFPPIPNTPYVPTDPFIPAILVCVAVFIFYERLKSLVLGILKR